MPTYKYLHEYEPARPATADKPSASPVYRSVYVKDGFPTVEFATLFEMFEQSCIKYPNNQCLGKRDKNEKGEAGPFVFKTYAEVHKEVVQAASALRALGVEPSQRVGVFGANCPEWMVAMQACNRMSLQCVPLYDSLGENAVEYIINHSESVAAFCSTQKLPALVKALPRTKETLKSVIYWGPGKEDAIKAATDIGYKVLSFSELLALGAEKPAEPVPPKPEELCTIMYTSGTTGAPKGVMLTHAAVVAAVNTAGSYCKFNNVYLNDTDRMLSYLPLAHIFDRVNEEWFLSMGAAIGYWQGDVTKLVDDVAALQPSLFIGVPRVFDRIYTGIMSQINNASFLKRSLFNWGFSRKLYFLRQGYSHTKAAPFFDKLIFSKVAARFGGKVKAVVSGGAPLAPHVEDFLRVIMCAPVVQGYGLTETNAASFIAAADVMEHAATVGPPTPLTEFRLESVPDMKCDALDPKLPKGEVLIRGAANFTGYYKAQDKTDEVVESDGWFHTGDIAVITPTGAIKIVDRKKNIFKLSQGEYVAVEALESTYKKATVVEQVWVYGNSFENCLVAVVVPNKAVITAWAKEAGVSGGYEEGLLEDPRVNQYILSELVRVGKEDKLKGYEIIKAVHLDHVQFSVEEDLMTPSFKLRRPQLQAKYQKVIDAMYTDIKKKEAEKTRE
ncbi:hypothetical protein VOLCADRAFT_73402 [Volvox carteri f. nagariensis]|uniref:Long-chain-fatty-acid--CoA ligase n=1 Tax=Volvox carteri f. nagariensis TaxID=3068 RepID=D8TMY5_VOLCA|nr:uncharacterized protein VOLCADRAFT_73402 [Volvox carteri f. nagariensis]EFJ51208.1 hypothetical protein VOLCADRAFT_73402 [Volvox carteri f. nagariensis]|eukprot:XP_002947675.1 hypothetical protein VOLCADRAFT_73402 [Volvox carteri f. nagariensis]